MKKLSLKTLVIIHRSAVDEIYAVNLKISLFYVFFVNFISSAEEII